MIAFNHRLSGRDILKIFQKPNQNLYRSFDGVSILYSTQNQDTKKRFTIVISKKIGKSNVRHTIRRKLYAIIDNLILRPEPVNCPFPLQGKNGDYIVMVKYNNSQIASKMRDLTYQNWQEIFTDIWHKIQRKLGSGGC